MREAELFRKEDGTIECLACARRCKIPPNLFGFCGARYNKNGKLIVANYGLFIAINLDPIEKKPLFHFFPGSYTLSLGTTGCSWACRYCINYDISQRRKLIGYEFSPEEVVNLAKSVNSKIITFTYNEPSIYAEFSYDTSKYIKKEKMYLTWVSNGYFTDELIDHASKFLDAITIDIKGNANPDFMKKFALVPDSEPVIQAIEELYKKGVHVEITDLIVPKFGDSLEDARRLSKKIYDIMGEDSNIHFLRFHPEYKMLDHYSTPIDTLEKHAEIAKEEGVKYVYIGNVPGHPLENTYCPNCGKPVIKRYGFEVYEVNLTEKNRCKFCGEKISIFGKARISKLKFPMWVPIEKEFVERKIENEM